MMVMLAMVSSMIRAQEFTTIDWNVLRIDTLLPVYSEVVPLESDYRLYDYRVTAEYPEWKPATAAETKALEAFGNQIGEELCIDSWVGVSRRKGVLDISFVPVVKEGGKYKKLISAKIVITPVRKDLGVADPQKVRGISGAQRVSKNGQEGERFVRNSKLSTGKWVKISITEDGMYRLTANTLRKMGFNKPENVHLYGHGGHRLSQVMNPDEMYDDLVEVPLYREDGRSTLYFWGNGLVYWQGDQRIFNPYATKAYYFLTEEDTPCEIQTAQTVKGEVKHTFSSTRGHLLYEKDDFSWFQGGRNLYESANFGTIMGHRRSYKLQTAGSVGNEKLTVSYSGFSTTLTPTVNGKALAGIKVGDPADFVYCRLGEKTYDVSDCKKDNTWDITLQTNSDKDARLDYMALHYDRPLATTAGYVPFSQTGTGVSRFMLENDAVWLNVMCVSEPGKPAELIPVEFDSKGSAYVTVDDPSHQYVAFAPAYEFPEPQYEGTVENQNLHALDSIDMVIIIPANGKLLGQAQRLAEAHRAYDGLRVAVVRADQVYNEFSSGTPDATAYRMLMKMLYDRASGDYEGPRYLLLMGACLWDNRMLTPATRNCNPEDYLLCFESENSWNDTESYVMEDYFGLLDDGEGSSLTRDKMDIGVGRFPVKSVAEAKIMVDKTIAYMSNSNAGSWKNQVMMLGDDGDNNSHMLYCNDVAERIIGLYPELEVRKVMWDAYTRESSIAYNTYPEVTELVTKQVNEGAMMINYTGHAAPYSMSHEWVLKLQDFQTFKGRNLPLWFTAACDVMPFDSQTENMGVTAVLNDGGAALAFVGTARTVYASNNRSLNLNFCEYLFGTDQQGRRYRLGDALRLAKVALAGTEVIHLENKLQYALLGDPALLIGAPLNRVRLDGIYDAKSGQALTQLKAGQAVRMEGRLLDEHGEELNDFNGIVTARVYDSMDTIVCKRNDPKITTAYEFTDRNQVIFSGRDSVRLGRFTLTFVVPQDIKYSNGSGRVVFYAINDSLTQEANGCDESFTVGGVALSEDGEGPKIELALNGEFDGVVNSTPYLTARLEDASGINVSGTGIGHDLLLCIDGDARQTYVLNDYYVPDFGDYTKGSVAFTIPALTPGTHTLTLRAWDLLNNTSVQSMDFTVDAAYEPTILHLMASPTIATQSTTFLLAYDLPGSQSEYEIEVFDYAGRRLWHYKGEGSSQNGVYAIPWNLSVGDNRGRISPGVYLYRASLKCGESKVVTESKKLIVN